MPALVLLGPQSQEQVLIHAALFGGGGLTGQTKTDELTITPGQFTHNLGWIAFDVTVRRHIAGNHRSRPHNAAASHRHPRQNHRAQADPGAILDGNRLGQNSPASSLGAGTNLMSAGVHPNVGPNRHVLSQENRGVEIDGYMVSNNHAWTDNKFLVKPGEATVQFQVAHNEPAGPDVESR